MHSNKRSYIYVVQCGHVCTYILCVDIIHMCMYSVCLCIRLGVCYVHGPMGARCVRIFCACIMCGGDTIHVEWD